MPSAPPSKRGLSWWLSAGYGLGSLGTGMFSTVPGLLLLYFMTDTLGIPAGMAGLAIFVPKMWDVVIDPVLGSLSDHTHTRWGRRRPWMLAGGVTLPLAFLGMFVVPEFSAPALTATYVSVLFVLAATCFSFFQVPYVAMPAEITEDPHQRTVVVGWRIAFMTLGILLAGALAPVLITAGGGGRPGYQLMAGVLSVACFLSLVGSFLATAGVHFTEHVASELPLREQLRLALGNRPFFMLLLAGILQLTGVATVLAAVPYFAHYVLGGGENTVTLLFVSLVLPAMLTMPLWVKISKRVGKIRAYQMSVTLFAVMDLSLLTGSSHHLNLLYLQVAMMGAAYAGTQLFPFALLPDIITLDFEKTGLRREGTFTGMWTASEQIGMAVGAGLAGVVLSLFGFVESTTGQVTVQPDSALLGIRLTFGLVPALLLLLSVPVLGKIRMAVLSRPVPAPDDLLSTGVLP